MEPVQVGKYQLLDRIGTGGMAEVHLARVVGAAGFEKLVVVKRLLPALAEESDYVAQFIDEARLAATFSHANIVSTFDFGEADGSYFIAMEYVEGKNLRRIQDVLARRGRGIPESVAVHVVSELCRGLEYAHTRKDQAGNLLNVVHRDVSPQNVVVAYSGDTKVLDFGIAKSNAREFKTAAGIVKGKLRYMSPEQVANEAIDGRSDLFAAGVILWELLFGKRPMPDMPDTELVEWVRKGEFTRPAQPVCRAELSDILNRALAADVANRYPSCGEFARALSRYNSQFWPEFTPGDLARLLEVEFAEDMKKERAWIAGILGGFSAAKVPEKSISIEFGVGVVPSSMAIESPSFSGADSRAENPTVQTPSRGLTMSKGFASAELPIVRGDLDSRVVKGKSGLAQAPSQDDIEPAGTGRKRSNVLPWIGGIGALVLVAVGFAAGGFLPGVSPTPTSTLVVAGPSIAPTPFATFTPIATLAVVEPTEVVTAVPTRTRAWVVRPTAAPTATPVRTVATATPTAIAFAGPPGKLNISVETGWAEVWIDGRKIKSETPLLNHSVAPGNHEIWVMKAGKKISRRIIVRSGETQRIVLPLPQ